MAKITTFINFFNANIESSILNNILNIKLNDLSSEGKLLIINIDNILFMNDNEFDNENAASLIDTLDIDNIKKPLNIAHNIDLLIPAQNLYAKELELKYIKDLNNREDEVLKVINEIKRTLKKFTLEYEAILIIAPLSSMFNLSTICMFLSDEIYFINNSLKKEATILARYFKFAIESFERYFSTNHTAGLRSDYKIKGFITPISEKSVNERYIFNQAFYDTILIELGNKNKLSKEIFISKPETFIF